MRCSKCGFENPGGMKFCGQCTAPLALVCPKCRFENPPGFKFCGQCTAPLSVSEVKTAPSVRMGEVAADAEAVEGERKTVTALFADIKGSMELIEDLDPEEARAPGRSRAQADDGRGASLRGLCGAIDRGWHLRVVRRSGRA